MIQTRPLAAGMSLHTAHPLQTHAWANYYRALGFKIVETGGPDDESRLQVLLQTSKTGRFRLAYLPRAPLPDRQQIENLKQIIRDNSCLSLKIEPCHGWLLPLTERSRNEQSQIFEWMKSQGGVPSQGFYAGHTMHIRLDCSDEEQLQSIHQKTRYNIRLSERHGIKVTEDTSDECFDAFLRLFFEDTVPRADIDYPHSEASLRLFWNIMKPTGALHLLKAVSGSEITGIMMLFKSGNTLYFPHGASNRKHQNQMPNYSLLWQAIRFGKSLNCTVLDLWGIREPLTIHENGLYRFFSGFGARTLQWAGSFDFLYPDSGRDSS